MTAHSVKAEQPAKTRADATAPTAVASGQGDTPTPARAQIRSRLKTDLARHFQYPYVARLRGWEGDVLLAFTVDSNGRLKRIRVAHSSGFPVLDRSALDSLGKVGYIKEAIAWLNGHAVDMQVPVIYRLEDAR
jgi:protein TonB